MVSDRTYGHFCGLARALDHIGDRWTLLVIRELLGGPCTYSQLQRQLHGISPNLLADRLCSLHDDGLVTRVARPGQARSGTYTLTSAGHELEPAVIELIRWGARWMQTGPGDDHIHGGWAPLALRALLDGTKHHSDRVGNVLLDIDGQQMTVSLRAARRSLVTGWSSDHAATIACTLPAALAVASGARTFGLIKETTTGDLELAMAALTP